MQTKIFLVVGCVFFLAMSSIAIAGDSEPVSAPSEVTVATVHVDDAGKINKDPKLQKWLQGIKPAAGTNYWQQKVVRRSTRKIVKVNE